MSIAVSLRELRGFSDDEVPRSYDEAAKNTVVGTQFYLDELRRRQDVRYAETLLVLTTRMTTGTEEIRGLTRRVTAAAVVGSDHRSAGVPGADRPAGGGALTDVYERNLEREYERNR